MGRVRNKKGNTTLLHGCPCCGCVQPFLLERVPRPSLSAWTSAWRSTSEESSINAHHILISAQHNVHCARTSSSLSLMASESSSTCLVRAVSSGFASTAAVSESLSLLRRSWRGRERERGMREKRVKVATKTERKRTHPYLSVFVLPRVPGLVLCPTQLFP